MGRDSRPPRGPVPSLAKPPSGPYPLGEKAAQKVLDQTGSQGRTAFWGSPRWPKGLGRVRGGVSLPNKRRRPWRRGLGSGVRAFGGAKPGGSGGGEGAPACGGLPVPVLPPSEPSGDHLTAGEKVSDAPAALQKPSRAHRGGGPGSENPWGWGAENLGGGYLVRSKAGRTLGRPSWLFLRSVEEKTLGQVHAEGLG